MSKLPNIESTETQILQEDSTEKLNDSIQSNGFNISTSQVPGIQHSLNINSSQQEAMLHGALNFNYVRKHLKNSGSVDSQIPIGKSTTISTSKYMGSNEKNEKYSRPYPGFAFKFDHINSYTSRAPENFDQTINTNTNKSIVVENVYGEDIDNTHIIQSHIPKERLQSRGAHTHVDNSRNLQHNLQKIDQLISGGNISQQLSETHMLMKCQQEASIDRYQPNSKNSSEEFGSELNRFKALPKIKFRILDDIPISQILPQNENKSNYYKKEMENLTQRLSQPRFANSQHLGKRFNLMSPKEMSSNFHGTDHQTSVFTPRERQLAPLISTRGGSVGLHQQQKFKVNKGRVDYTYKPKKGEFTEDMMQMCGSNKYHEGTNPLVQKFINSVQGNIKVSNKNKVGMKNTSQKIFEMMKKEKHRYIKTLVRGEDEGHCKGIKKRLDPTIKINLKQEQDKYERIQQERLEKVQQEKKQRDKENLIKSRQRIQEKMNILNQHTTTLTKKERQGGPNAFLKSFQKNTLKSNLKQKNLAVLFNASPMQTSRKHTVLNAGQSFPIPSKKNTGAVVQFQIDEDDEKHQATREIELLVDGVQDCTSPTSMLADDDDLIDMEHLRLSKRMHTVAMDEEDEDDNSFNNGSNLTHTQTQPLKNIYKGNKSPNKSHQSAQKQPNMKRSTVIAQGLNIQKYITDEQKRTIDKVCIANPSSVVNNLFNFYKREQVAQLNRQKNNQTPGGSSKSKKKPILNGFKSLGIAEELSLQNFFRGMCESDISIKHAGLKKTTYKQFLQERYSRQVGEKILSFMESEYQSFYNIGFNSFLTVLSDFLNDGPDTYRKMLFECLSLSNPGRICEHDIFTLLEQFKQRESFFFYQDLITQNDVPRDYQKINDKSDQVFFEVFSKDVKKLSMIINLKKRMMGIQDFDTVNGIESDFSFEKYPGTIEQYEEDIINQINYIFEVIVKSFSGQSREDKEFNFNELMDLVFEAQSLQELRNSLCEKCNSAQLLNNNKRPSSARSAISTSTYKSGGQSTRGTRDKPPSSGKNSSIGSSKDVKTISGVGNPCLGHTVGNKDPRKKISECISITYKDFKKLMGPKNNQEVPGLAADFIKVMTLEMIDLRVFERQMSHYRESGTFNGTLFKPKVPIPVDPEGSQENFTVRKCTTRKAATNSPTKSTQQVMKATAQDVFQQVEKKQYVPKHVIREPFTVRDHYASGEFAGKILIKQTGHRRKKTRELMDSILDKNDSTDDSDLIQIIPGESIQQLSKFKEHFGIENFYNIFKCFYNLTNISNDTENNIFSLYMDPFSVVRGFDIVFGVDVEEVAIRFFNLFVEPVGKPKMQKIDINRFYYVVQQICDIDSESLSHIAMAFRFYDYDNNKNIGSVDIVNLIKNLPTMKIDKIFQKQQEIYKFKHSKVTMRDTHRKKLMAKLDQVETESEDEDDEDSDNSVSNSEASISLHSEKKPADDLSMNSQEREKAKQRKMLADRFDIKDTTSYRSHTLSNQVSDPWNKVLFEIKLLRNYFVNEAVLPAQKSQFSSQNFLNLKRFEQKFVHMNAEKYQMNMPAISYFFREKFICKSSKKTNNYGSSMFLESTGSSMALYTYKMGSGMNLGELIQELGYGKVSNEFLQMLDILNTCSTVPKMLNLE